MKHGNNVSADLVYNFYTFPEETLASDSIKNPCMYAYSVV